jgi:hypothetical protein
LVESSGVVEGIRAGGDVRVLMRGNPTVTGGQYQDAFGRNRAIWKTFTISAFDTPNLQGVTIEQLLAMSDDELAIAPTPYLITRRWVKERYLRRGPNHPMYRAGVLGEFPEQSELSVYSLAWIEAASQEPEALPDDGKERVIQVGIDVAGPGEDETVMVARVGGVIIFTKRGHSRIHVACSWRRSANCSRIAGFEWDQLWSTASESVSTLQRTWRITDTKSTASMPAPPLWIQNTSSTRRRRRTGAYGSRWSVVQSRD